MLRQHLWLCFTLLIRSLAWGSQPSHAISSSSTYTSGGGVCITESAQSAAAAAAAAPAAADVRLSISMAATIGALDLSHCGPADLALAANVDSELPPWIGRPKGVGKLVRLRMLAAAGNRLAQLPSSLCCNQYLRGGTNSCCLFLSGVSKRTIAAAAPSSLSKSN
eukprot:jgi/Mesen1/7853/ME000042S07296